MNKVIISGKIIEQTKTKKKSIYQLVVNDNFIIGCCNENIKSRNDDLVNKKVIIEGKLGKPSEFSTIVYVYVERLEIIYDI